MTDYKREMCEYVDACHANNIPINSFTYWVYRVNATPVLFNFVKRVIVRISYAINKRS